MKKERMSKALGLLLMLALMFAALPIDKASAATLCVAPGGAGGCYATIQGAINAASAGDTIEIQDGTYNYVSEGSPAPDGLIKVSKPVTIKAADDGNGVRPVIDGSGFNGVFKIYTTTFTNGTVTIENLDITGDPFTSTAITAPMKQVPGSENTIIIRNNLIHGMIGGIDFWGSGDVAGYKVISNIEISGNEFYGLGYPGYQGFGIMLEDPADWAKAGNKFAAIVEGNVFRNFVDGSGNFADLSVGIIIPRADASNGEAANVRIASNAFPTGVGIDVVITAGDVSDAEVFYNDFGDSSGVGLFADNITNGPVDASRNWWGDASGPAITSNPGGVGDGLSDNVKYSPWLGFGIGILPMTWHVNPTGSIQEAVDIASAGDTVIVADGTYTYLTEGSPVPAGLIKVSKPLTIKAADDGNSVRPVIDGSGFDGIFKIWHSTFSGGDIVIEGFDLVGDAVTGIAITAAMCDSADPTDIIIRDNLIHGMIGGINFWGGGFCVAGEGEYPRVEDVEILDNQFYDLGIAGIQQGVGVLLEGLSSWSDAGNEFAALVDGNTFADIYSKDASNPGGGVVIDMPSATPTGVSNVLISDNTFDDTLGMNVALFTANADDALIELNDFGNSAVSVFTLAGTVDASPNWFGSILGPSVSQLVGDVTYDPWCGDPECSFLVSKTAGAAEMYLNAKGELILSGNINVPGGIEINEEGLIIKLMDGAKVENSSPCFIVNASYTKITTESIGGAQCVPTAGSNGIDVAGGLKNIIIEGIDFVGTNGTDAIHFAGTIEDLVIRDNYIHDFGGDCIEFTSTITNNQGIQGNLFVDNAGLAIRSGVAVNAEYNSWGAYAPAAIPNVDMDYPTHVDLYMTSSGSPWVNQVAEDGQISYTVYGNLKNVMAMDFTLKYPVTALAFDGISYTLGGNFDSESFTVNTTAGTLNYMAYNTDSGATTGEDLALFTVTFKAKNQFGTFALNLDETTDIFGMGPTYGPSTNIYVTALTDDEVNIIELPEISSTDLSGYYLTDERQEFHVSVDNPPTGGDYDHVIFHFSITADVGEISLFEYWEGSDWQTFSLDCTTVPGLCTGDYGPTLGFPMAPDYEATSLFRVTAAEPGAYPVTITLEDLDASTTLATYSETAQVYDKATVIVSSDPYFIVDESGGFLVTINNPTTGRFYNNTAVFDIVIEDHVVADITALSCTDGTTTWPLLASLVQDGTDVKARIGGLDGYFTIPPTGIDATVSCTVTFATTGDYITSGHMVDVIAVGDERMVSINTAATATAYTRPTITSTNLVGPYVAGIPQDFTLTITDPDGIPEPFELVFGFPNGTIIVYDSVSYTCNSAGCPPIPVSLLAASNDLEFTVAFVAPFTGSIPVNLYDSDWMPDDRLLSTHIELAIEASGDFDVTATITMQARTVYSGVTMTLTDHDGLPVFGPFAVVSMDVMSNNLGFSDLMGGTYLITTSQARYLDVIAANNKTLLVNGNETIAALHLRGGNVNNTGDSENEITLGDASLIAGMYGDTGDPLALGGDANFDGRVNIQDLALVGGNYGLTSLTAYGVGNADIWVIN